MNELRRLLEMGLDPKAYGYSQDPMTGEYVEPQQNELASMIQMAGQKGNDVLTAPQAFDMGGRPEPTVNGDFQVYAGEGMPARRTIEMPERPSPPERPQMPGRPQMPERPQNPLGEAVEVPGRGKGRYAQDGRSVVFPDGSTHDLFPAASADRARAAFQQMLAMQKLQGGQLGMEKTRAEIDAMRQPKPEKAPEGYRFKPDGSLEAIAGGPAATKQADSAGKEAARKQAMLTGADVVLGKVDEALGKTGWSTAGMVGGALRNVPGSDAFDLNKTVDTLKARIGFDTLAAMREASPTGGALGQVAVQELAMLQSTIASLDTAQSPEQLRQSLAAVRDHYDNWKKTLTGGQEQPPQQPQSGAPKVGEVRKGYRFKGGNPASQSSWEKV